MLCSRSRLRVTVSGVSSISAGTFSGRNWIPLRSRAESTPARASS